MSTLKHLDLALIDLRDRLTRELQFSAEAEAQITAAIATVSDGLTHLDRTIRNAFAERNRALETALGASAPAQRIWGRQIITDQNLAAGTALVLDTNYFSVAMRRNVTLSMTDSHGTDFIGNILRFKADLRGNVVSFRDAAACKVTGL